MKQSDVDKKDQHQITFSEDPASSLVGETQRVKNLPRLTGASFRPKNTPEHTYFDPKNHNDLKVRALFDFWSFIDLYL